MLPLHIEIDLYGSDSVANDYWMLVAVPHSDESVTTCMIRTGMVNEPKHIRLGRNALVELEAEVRNRLLITLFEYLRVNMVVFGGEGLQWWHPDVTQILKGRVPSPSWKMMEAALAKFVLADSHVPRLCVVREPRLQNAHAVGL